MYSIAGAPTNGTDEVQRLTPGGTISGGTFMITFEGQQSAPIQWNATAAQVKAALEALSNVADGDITATGGPVQTAAIDITFGGGLGGFNRTQVTVQSSLTGSAPTLTPSTVTGGVQGSFRGAKPGDSLQDTTNAVIYRNTGTSATPTWTVPAAVPTWTVTDPPYTAYVDSSRMPRSNDYTYAPFTM